MKIACMGSLVYDMTFVVDDKLEEDSKKRAKEFVACGGGNGSNYAYALASWDNDVDLYSIIGNDLDGKKLVDEFNSKKVDMSGVEIRDNFITPKSVIISNIKNATRSIVTTYREKIRRLDTKIKSNYDVILLDGSYIDSAKELLDNNKEATIIFDLESVDEEKVDLAKKSNYIICSRDFAEEFTNIDLSSTNIDLLKECYDKLNNYFNNSTIIITLGKDGCFTKLNDYKLIDSIKVDAIDTTGSGDIFHAAFAHFLYRKYDIEKVIKYSTIAAGLSTRKVGCRNKIPTWEEVLNYEDVI